MRLFAPLLLVDESDSATGLRRFERSDSLPAFDAVLAATALAREVEALVPADRDFGNVSGVVHVHPQEEERRWQVM